jgi:hypothetical protein
MVNAARAPIVRVVSPVAGEEGRANDRGRLNGWGGEGREEGAGSPEREMEKRRKERGKRGQEEG